MGGWLSTLPSKSQLHRSFQRKRLQRNQRKRDLRNQRRVLRKSLARWMPRESLGRVRGMRRRRRNQR
jgi:hypothetical protein